MTGVLLRMAAHLTQSLPFTLRVAAATLNRAGDARVSRHGVTMEQYVVLRALEAEDGLSLSDICRRVSSDQSTIGAIVLRLRRASLVRRVPDATDARVRRVFLTKRARRVLDEISEDIEPVRRRIRRALPPDDARQLSELLVRLIRAFLPNWPAADPAAPSMQRNESHRHRGIDE